MTGTPRGIAPATGPVRVIKIGGRPQADPSLAARVAAAWEATGGRLVLVHGGGDEVSALQRAFGVQPSFIGGRRVTAVEDVERLRMALSGSANKRLVAALVSAGVPAVGLSGEDAALIGATHGAAVLGRVGNPVAVNTRLLVHLLAGGYLPVVSPLSREVDAAVDQGVPALNVNGDDAAAAIAAALGAADLLLVSDVEGVLAEGEVIPSLTPGGVRRLVADGTAARGMAAKLEAAVRALDGGVRRVRIGNLAAIADSDRGTVVMRDHSPAWSL